MITDLTPEERKINLEKARLAMAEKKAWAEQNLRQEYADEPYWRKLASKHGVAMPPWYQPANAQQVRKCLRKLGKDINWFKDFTGLTKAEDWFKLNKNMPAWAFMGICLEHVEYCGEINGG